VAYDDALTNLGAKSIYPGDWCVVDPQEPPKPGDVVHAVDPETDLTVLRIFRPLHPSNPRAPGYILAASTPGFDEIYVPGHIGIQGVVVEKRSLLRR
jgi:SOS-response transcriptional repressor LexA